MMFNVIDVMPKRIASIAIKYYGAKAQKIKAIEELSELQQIIAKDLNGDFDRYKLIEEYADVCYMQYQISVMHNITADEVANSIRFKADRLYERIKEMKPRE